MLNRWLLFHTTFLFWLSELQVETIISILILLLTVRIMQSMNDISLNATFKCASSWLITFINNAVMYDNFLCNFFYLMLQVSCLMKMHHFTFERRKWSLLPVNEEDCKKRFHGLLITWRRLALITCWVTLHSTLRCRLIRIEL